jgi:hypothetical protein
VCIGISSSVWALLNGIYCFPSSGWIKPSTQQAECSDFCSTMKMEGICSCETPVNFYRTTGRHIRDYDTLNFSSASIQISRVTMSSIHSPNNRMEILIEEKCVFITWRNTSESDRFFTNFIHLVASYSVHIPFIS